MDTILVDRLIEILNKETAAYEDFLKLSKDKTDMIVEGKVSELESLTRAEQSMLLQLAKLEEEREELVGMLAVQLHLKAADITLVSLEKLLPEDQAGKLKSCHDTLSVLLSDLNETNVLNSKLIRNSLEYIDFSINILTNAGSTGNNYGYSGQPNESGKMNFFDMKL